MHSSQVSVCGSSKSSANQPVPARSLLQHLLSLFCSIWLSVWPWQSFALGCSCPGYLVLSRPSFLLLRRKNYSQSPSVLTSIKQLCKLFFHQRLRLHFPQQCYILTQAFNSATQEVPWYESKNSVTGHLFHSSFLYHLKVLNAWRICKGMRLRHSHKSLLLSWIDAMNKHKQEDILVWCVHFSSYPAKGISSLTTILCSTQQFKVFGTEQGDEADIFATFKRRPWLGLNLRCHLVWFFPRISKTKLFKTLLKSET